MFADRGILTHDVNACHACGEAVENQSDGQTRTRYHGFATQDSCVYSDVLAPPHTLLTHCGFSDTVIACLHRAGLGWAAVGEL